MECFAVCYCFAHLSCHVFGGERIMVRRKHHPYELRAMIDFVTSHTKHHHLCSRKHICSCAHMIAPNAFRCADIRDIAEDRMSVVEIETYATLCLTATAMCDREHMCPIFLASYLRWLCC